MTTALVVYESIYGNTHAIADQIGVGLRAIGDVHVIPVGEATHELVADADLIVVGGPTHVHGMSWKRSRRAAIEGASRGGAAVDAAAPGPGLREWFDQLGNVDGTLAAAFDTRDKGWPILTGSASRGITR